MEHDEIFDPEGGHDEEWALLSEEDKASMRGFQSVLQKVVDLHNPGKFLPTSGWRSLHGNRACGGAPRSRHLVGLARDFVRRDGCWGPPPIVPLGFRVIRSSRCWHVEVM